MNTKEFLEFLWSRISAKSVDSVEDLRSAITEIRGEEVPWFDALKEGYFQQLRADKNYENLTDSCLQDMAESLAKVEVASYRKVGDIWTSLLDVILRIPDILGLVAGIFLNAQAFGQQKANALRPINYPDLPTIIQGLYKKTINEGDARIWAGLQGYSEEVLQTFRKTLKPLLDISIISTLWHRGYLSVDDARGALEKYGYTDIESDNILKASLALLSRDDIRMLYLRGLIDEETCNSMLSALGYTDGEIENIKRLYELIPPVADIITMAVREAFTPEIAEKFGQYEDFPEEFAEWGKKQGLSEEWARRYWAAHWSLPSVMQGYDMLHRGVISDDELKTLMRALDIMPFWRDKLIKISYMPYTRVDVRRMYKEGVIERDTVKRTYLDLGYDDEHAENLTNFTIKDALSETRGLTRSQILDLYSRQIIDRDTTKDWLTAIGYPEDIVELYIVDTEYKREKKIKDRWISLCRKLYLENIYSDNDVIDKLSSINMLASEIDDLLDQWSLEREAQRKTLSWGQLRQLLEKKLIDKETFKKYMKMLHYPDDAIELLWKLAGSKITPAPE